MARCWSFDVDRDVRISSSLLLAPTAPEVYMRTALPLLLATAVAGCSSMEYKDTNAKVDADPLYASASDRPGEPVSARCKRETGVTYSSNKPSEPLGLSGKSRKKTLADRGKKAAQWSTPL